MQCLFLRFIFYNIINWAHYAIILTRNALIEARKAISQYTPMKTLTPFLYTLPKSPLGLPSVRQHISNFLPLRRQVWANKSDLFTSRPDQKANLTQDWVPASFTRHSEFVFLDISYFHNTNSVFGLLPPNTRVIPGSHRFKTNGLV